MITDLAHAAFVRHNDIDVSLAFYEKLGLEDDSRLHHDDGRLMLVYLHIAGDRWSSSRMAPHRQRIASRASATSASPL